MKKRLISMICTAVAMLMVFSATAAFPVFAEIQKITEDVFAAFDSGEEFVKVRITFAEKIDTQIIADKAREETAAYMETYDPALKDTEHYQAIESAHFSKLYNDYYSTALKGIATEIIDALNLDAETALCYRLTPTITCKLTREQLEAAEKNDLIKKIIKIGEWTYSEELGNADEPITDPEIIREMFAKFIQENALNARVADNQNYPGYHEKIIIEYVIEEGSEPINHILLDFAETYHLDTTITFVPILEGTPMRTTLPIISLIVRGDANLDNTLDISDAVLVARFVAEDNEADISEQGKQNADMNRDGNLTGDDVIAILRKIAKFD